MSAGAGIPAGGQVITWASLAPSRWRNGQGRRATIVAGDGWSLSHAWIDADAPFSEFAGMDRTCVFVTGGGLTLARVDSGLVGPGIVGGLTEPGARLRFPGEWSVRARLHDGACHVVNVMTVREEYAHVAQIGAPVPDADYVVVFAGEFSAAGRVVARRGDTLVRPAPDADAGSLVPSPDLLTLSVTITPLHP